MVKLLDPPRWVESIYDPARRAKAAGLPRPLQMSFDTGDERYRLVLTRRSSHLVADEATTADVTLHVRHVFRPAGRQCQRRCGPQECRNSSDRR